MIKIAILDDYAKVALQLADWSALDGKAEITVFDRHLTEDEAAVALKPFDVLCTVRERMSLPRSLFERLPNLKLVTIIGMDLPNLDMAAATEHGVIVSHSNFANPLFANMVDATPELTWGLMIATVRHLSLESRRMHEGAWQSTVGVNLAGRTLGLFGPRPNRLADGGIRARLRHAGDRVESEPDRRKGESLRRRAGREGRSVPPRRHRVDPRAPERSHARPRHCARTRAHETRRVSDQHVARTDRGRGRPARRAAGGQNRRRRPRRFRRGAAAARRIHFARWTTSPSPRIWAT